MNRLPDETVNYSEENLFKDLAKKALFLIILLGLIYAGSQALIHFTVTKISYSTEKKLFKPLYTSLFKKSHESPELQKRFQKLVSEEHAQYKDIQVYIQCNKIANAFALPGGKIIITSETLNNMTTNMGLEMVLAHELGHFTNKDHLQHMGFSLFNLLFQAVLGFKGDKFLDKILNQSSLTYSRKQETEADDFAIQSLLSIYPYLNGAEEFFEKTNHIKSKFEKKTQLLSPNTHPENMERILKIKKHSIDTTTENPKSTNLEVHSNLQQLKHITLLNKDIDFPQITKCTDKDLDSTSQKKPKKITPKKNLSF